MKDDEKVLHEQLDKKRNVYFEQKHELELKIAEVEAQLSIMGKRKKDAPHTDAAGKDSSISHEMMLSKLAERIRKVYKDYKDRDQGLNNDVANKQPLEILNVR